MSHVLLRHGDRPAERGTRHRGACEASPQSNVLRGLTRGLAGAFIVVATLVGTAGPARAQQVKIGGFDKLTVYTQEKLGDKHYLFTGSVELERGDTTIFADTVEYFEDDDRAIATGNVVVIQGANRIAADRAEFNTHTQLGTFYRASGIATVRQGRQRSPAGGISVPQTNLDNDVYYFGETVEKVGVKKYKITNGGFSTCVQPTPRWDLTADTIILSIDHYTLLKQALLNVKGVPLMYLPILYYPTKDEDRATGFLIPTYGISTIKGQTIHNAFFWAINRSQDATFLYDWFSKAGAGTGGEYRYNMGGGSDGRLTAYSLDQKATTVTNADSSTFERAGLRSFTVNGSANQPLPHRFRARATVDYFSSFQTNQTFYTDVNYATNNTRRYSANVYGILAGITVNGLFDRFESFYPGASDSTNSQVQGTSPRISLTRGERPLFGNAVYFGASGEVNRIDRLTKADDRIVPNGDHSLSRFDFAPQIRYPFKRFPFLTVNSTVAWRETYWSRSLDTTDSTGQTLLDGNVERHYATMAAQVVGPVLTRIWNTPDNGYAEKFKHTIEPVFTVQRTTAIDNYARLVKIDSTDSIFGDNTSLVYGLNNRFYAKRKVGTISQAQEILALEIVQTYYSNAGASRVDTSYSTSQTAQADSNFSPISVNLRAIPGQSVNASVRAEVDGRYKALRQLSANTNVNWRQQLLVSGGWSRSFYIAKLDGYNNRDALTNWLNSQATLQTRDRRYGAIYSFNYDIKKSAMLQQRISGFYNAQCCGIAAEYQRYNYSGLASYLVPADHRFFLSFTLAGLGNFSPMSGGLGGVPR